ncbi:lipopolysaccharide biosynthesis protein [Butyrivibrio sp. M55]|uniref:lipopolysaccharide biosynthesis protein n=1 Tax=Butyrivibrio sp. M55 TaxID=1855323 RepID=UPI0008E9AD5C|nr:oligosaccharide flippase family protein [Butyrivibrio sp. M55]SFU54661.1 Membrane protein involved in the export of O-antigen and teichoic acid [Butyrivibrio sp. M55]
MLYRRHSLKIGVIISYLWVAVRVIVNLISIPFYIKLLGKGEYGLYQIVGSFFSYINAFEVSISAGVMRFYCKALARKNIVEQENVLAISRKIYRFFSLLIIGCGIFCAYLFRVFYRGSFSDSEINEGSKMLLLLFFNLIISVYNGVYIAAINGNEHFIFQKGLACITLSLQPIIAILLLKRYPYAITIIIVTIFLNLLAVLSRYVYSKRILKIKVKMHYKDIQMTKRILIFSASILLASIADEIFWRADQIILGKLYNTVMVAVYAVGVQIYSVYINVGSTISYIFYPRVSKYYAQKDGIKKINSLFIKTGRFSFFLCYMILSGFMIFGQEFLFYWVGDDFKMAYVYAVIIMIPLTVDLLQNLGLTILQVMNKYAFRARMYFVSAVVNVFLTTVLSIYFAGIGAAISTGITIVLSSGIVLNVYYAKNVGLNIKEFWMNIISVLFKSLPFSVGVYFINSVIKNEQHILWFFVRLLIYVVLYYIYIYYFCMNKYEKNYIARTIFLNKRI